MNSYILNFGIYSFAMIGVFAVMILIYKKSAAVSAAPFKKNFLKVENMLKLTPAKTIYVIKAGSEKFLIAGDPANTTMLAKLENNQEDQQEEASEIQHQSSIKPFNLLEFLREKALSASEAQRKHYISRQKADETASINAEGN